MRSRRRSVSRCTSATAVTSRQRRAGVVVRVYFQVRCLVTLCKLPLVLCFHLFCAYFFIKFSYRKICSIVDNCSLLESMHADIYNLYEMTYMSDGPGANYLFSMYSVMQLLSCLKFCMYTYPENSIIYNMTIHLYSECHICTMLNNNLHVLANILVLPVQIVVMLLFRQT